MTSLREVVRALQETSDDLTIYATRPWRPESEAIVTAEPEAGGRPDEARRLGMEYFLEACVAREFLEGWLQTQSADVPLDQQCERLIAYAVNDA